MGIDRGIRHSMQPGLFLLEHHRRLPPRDPVFPSVDLVPIEGAISSSARWLVSRIDVYWEPASELSRTRLNSDYAEVDVMPRNPVLASAGAGWWLVPRLNIGGWSS